MIVEERMRAYINSLDRGHTPFLEELAREAAEGRVPVIRREMQSFLKVFLMIQRPRKILEVGTAIGFSAVFMAEYGPEDCRITTIENYEKRIPIARENIKRSGYGQRITLIPGDAAEVLKTLEGSYDLIFMDAAKGQYIRFLPEVLRLMGQGSVLISDNVLQEGDLIESHYLVERRDRTIYKRMREYLYTLKHSGEMETTILHVGDGITLSVRR